MDNRFINRKKETKWLKERYQQAYKEGQLLIIYGKRRVGKTELVKHFSKSKDLIYYLATRSSASDQLSSVTQTFTTHFGDSLSRTSFNNWRDLFKYIGSRLEVRKDPPIIVFDEFPYLVDSEDGMSSYFQYGWDEYLKDKKVLMIIMGSSISMMYKHTLIYSSPLYGRRTGQWLLDAFSYEESKEFYPNSSFGKTFPLYAISGGIPAYLRVFDGELSLKENIKKYVFPEGRFLSVEPELLLAGEFSDPRSYLSILKAIGLGRTKFSEIVNVTGIPATAMPGYLQTLMRLKLVKKEVPITDTLEEKSKKGTYSLADAFLRFYFSFIYPNNSLIKSGNYETVFERQDGVLKAILSKCYEEKSKEFIVKAMGQNKIPFFEKFGRWWNKNTEIDLIGLNERANSILFAETKWNEKPLSLDVLGDLKQKSKEVIWGKENRKELFALIAKGGFSDELINVAKKENILLIEEDKVKL